MRVEENVGYGKELCMHVLILVMAALVAAEHLYIMYLETVATTSAKTAQTFGMSQDVLADKHVSTLLKNQGVYNGLLAILLLVSAFLLKSEMFVELLFAFVFLVASYGAKTSSPKILLLQGGPALVGLLLCIVL